MRTLAPFVRWVGPETFHITLQFLGETQKIDEIKTAPGNCSRRSGPTTAFRGAGFFPNPNRARVFWVGIESDEQLQDLVDCDRRGPCAVRIQARRRAHTIRISRWRVRQRTPACAAGR